MNVSDIMTLKPVTIKQENTIHMALETMARVGCHHLPVIGYDGHVVGILTDKDCRTALELAAQHGQDSKTLLVKTYMTAAPIVVEPDTPADEAARLMLKNHISCLPVMRVETLVGIITVSDLLIAFMNLYKRLHRTDLPATGK
jgi:acetoin utilization protein AcuB